MIFMKREFYFSAFTTIFCFVASVSAQLPNPSPSVSPEKTIKAETKIVQVQTADPAPTATPAPTKISETKEPTDAAKILPNDIPENIKNARRGQLSEEEAAIVPYYNNFMNEYRLGPEDVISVQVFGQPNYSKSGITVPPNARISYPLIREGVFVGGKTVEQVADEIAQKLNEFIIDPKVTVSVDRAVSARYSVLGDVARPGAQIMTRRLSVYQAIAEAGGVLPTGNKKEVVVLRTGADGLPKPIIVNLRDIERGKVAEMVYLVPGDQVIVQGNKIKAWRNLLSLLPIIGFARGIATGGLF
jgi:polysaccharide export outer membrane protein